MKQKLIGLSQKYVTALRKHLKQGAHASLEPAVRLGRQAVALGLETLELARIHEQSLTVLELSKGKNSVIKRAEIFFNEAISPIVQGHRAARENKVTLGRLNQSLDRRALRLAATNRQLQRGILQRKVIEQAFAKDGRRHDKSLAESLRLQNHLRGLTHQALSAQEDERKKISRELQDEIAQTLLGINVQLLSLQRKARGDTRGLKQEIASTQRLVERSAISVRRFARDLDIHN